VGREDRRPYPRQGNAQARLTQLGFEEESLAVFTEAIHKPWGIVLVTGPTGSGKTNTLYSAISTINSPDMNIMTAEDPVEFNVPNINQVQIKEEIGLTFASCLRSFLRQDPTSCWSARCATRRPSTSPSRPP